MEFLFMKHFFEDKQIVNPMNPDEVFSCQDLTDDYKICRREKRLQTAAAGKRVNCTDYRKLANQCFYMEESEFVDHVIERY
mmetsp:Transcript_34542/g.45441  ORF Transcript_34542/g.45441 Transcript_34542/m.45441 type:complete len:81 (-) Transcript_34542:184-426(-)